MKKQILAAVSVILLLFTSACVKEQSDARHSSPVQTAAVSSAMKDGLSASEFAREYYLPLVEKALGQLERSGRDELSSISYAFDAQYAYSFPSDDMIALVDDGRDYEEAAPEYFDAVCELVIEHLPQEASAYDKYRYLAYFVSLCADYDLDGSAGIMSLTPYGAIMSGAAVCLGFTNSFLYLCEKADLWCRAVNGYAEHNGEAHGWNLVLLEDGSYYIDVTWCDGVSGDISDAKWLKYFMRTQEDFSGDHGVSEDIAATGLFEY